MYGYNVLQHTSYECIVKSKHDIDTKCKPSKKLKAWNEWDAKDSQTDAVPEAIVRNTWSLGLCRWDDATLFRSKPRTKVPGLISMYYVGLLGQGANAYVG